MPDLHESRFNAVKHGCCARSPVLPGEDETLWREVEAHWFAEYDPQTPVSETLVGEAVLAFWQVARNRRHFQQYELSLSEKNAMHWSNEEHLNYSRFLRYKTAAERSFSTAFKNLEYLRKARLSEAQALRRMENELHQLELKLVRNQATLENKQTHLEFEQQKHAEKTGTKPASPAKKPKKDTFDVAEQWVEVTITDGITRTDYVPTNEELLEELEKQQIEPKMVYRRLNFPDGLPPEYAWTNRHDPKTCETAKNGHWCPLCSVHERGGAGIQRMTFDTWLQIIEQESQTPGQHAGPTGAGNLPRPKERQGDTPFAELLDYVAWVEQNPEATKK